MSRKPVELRVDTLAGNAAARARGALSNASGRYDLAREPVDDGWAHQADAEEDFANPPSVATEVREECPRRIITWQRAPDWPFDRSINPYRGCEHGCIYCFARPSHAWLGMSAGLDFETKLIARPLAPQVLKAELRRPGYQVAPIAIGTNTDPYQPVEARWRVMRGCLEVLDACAHPVAIVTKGTLIERDIDILARMAERGLARAFVSLTTLNARLARRMEPRCPVPARRLKVVERLAGAGVNVGVMTAPVIPALTDHEIEALLQAAADAGAVSAGWTMLRLPGEVEALFREWIEQAFPHRAGRVMARLREMEAESKAGLSWQERRRGQGVHAQMIARRWQREARRLGLDRRQPPLRRDLFRPPASAGQSCERQMSLF